VSGAPQSISAPEDEHAHGAPARMGWAFLLRRVFDIDLEHCGQCGGELKIIVAIEELAVLANTVRLPVGPAGDIAANSEKDGLNYLYSDGLTVSEASRDVKVIPRLRAFNFMSRGLA
jgi:hypothetical protein